MTEKYNWETCKHAQTKLYLIQTINKYSYMTTYCTTVTQGSTNSVFGICSIRDMVNITLKVSDNEHVFFSIYWIGFSTK